MTDSVLCTVVVERTDVAVRGVIEAWVALLVEERYADALATLGRERPLLDPPSTATRWTPELLAKVIQNYGSVEPREDRKTSAVTPIATAPGSW